MDVDPGFTLSARQSRRRGLRRRLTRGGTAVAVLVAMAGRWLIWQRLPERQGTFDGPEMVQVETGAPESPAAFDRSALVRLRGDPLILRLADGEAGAPPHPDRAAHPDRPDGRRSGRRDRDTAADAGG
ncbi:hypothetical protein [Jannaschia rubra]|uniref:hypothetical protein n=1 Tax=Jannaschia rubra TaxID=282197 RepID=UPI0024935C17|nr:hypothetical protein [Jannaschia rubra]